MVSPKVRTFLAFSKVRSPVKFSLTLNPADVQAAPFIFRHALIERPQRLVQLHLTVNARHRASSHSAQPVVRISTPTRQPAPNNVLLDHVRGCPQIIPPIIRTAGILPLTAAPGLIAIINLPFRMNKPDHVRRFG